LCLSYVRRLVLISCSVGGPWESLPVLVLA
jgi:hypothetical protein